MNTDHGQVNIHGNGSMLLRNGITKTGRKNMEIDWDNFDLVTALRYAEDYAQFISQHPAGAAS